MTKHSKISYIKSGIRIVGFGFLPFGPVCLFVGAGLLIVAELFGIAEEWGATY